MAFSCYRMVVKFILPFSVGILFVSVALTKKVELTKGEPAKPDKDVTIKVVTWNVADNKNKQMSKEISEAAIKDVLRLEEAGGKPSIYAIGLQEDRWNCNQKNWGKIADRFLKMINAEKKAYEVVGTWGTREGNHCENFVVEMMHGTTLLVVIAITSLVNLPSTISFRHNEGCSSTPVIKNNEKGVAAMKVTLNNGKSVEKSVCFGAAHLDAAEPKYRHDCLKKFFATADEKVSWSTSCDLQFIFGDFNTRTDDIPSEPPKGAEGVTATEITKLKKTDELVGDAPWKLHKVEQDDKEKKKKIWIDDKQIGKELSLLKYVNAVQKKTFIEAKNVNFKPTFSIRPKEECDTKTDKGTDPCYTKGRPKSWTDRIIFTGDKNDCIRYGAIYENGIYGDHLPVYADFKIGLVDI